MIVLDTTVLVYAVGGPHPLTQPCRALLEAVGAARVQATTTPEVVQEFVHVRARRCTRADAAALGLRYAEGFAPLVPTNEEDLRRGLELFESHSSVGAFDAVLAAVALNREAEALVSADATFETVPGLRFVHPSSEEAEAIVH